MINFLQVPPVEPQPGFMQQYTAGGIYGTVKEIKETTLLIEVDGNVTLRIDKNMVVADNSDLQRQ